MNGKTAKLGRAYAEATKTDPRDFRRHWRTLNHKQKGKRRLSALHAIEKRRGVIDL